MCTRGRIRARLQAAQPTNDDRFLTALIEVGDDNRECFTDDATAIHRQSMLRTQRQFGVLEIDELFRRYVHRDLLLVADATGWTTRGRATTFRSRSGGTDAAFHRRRDGVDDRFRRRRSRCRIRTRRCLRTAEQFICARQGDSARAHCSFSIRVASSAAKRR